VRGAVYGCLPRPIAKMADEKCVDKFVFECFSTFGRDRHYCSVWGIHIHNIFVI